MADENDPWLSKLTTPSATGASASSELPPPANTGERDPWLEKLAPRPEPGKAKAPSFLESLSNSVTLGGRDVAAAVQGQNEFDYPEITSVFGSGLPFRDKAQLDFARGDQGLIDALRKRDPRMELSRDKYDNPVVRFQGQPYYLNRSGLSERDLAEFGRDAIVQGVPAIGAAALTGGAALPLRMGAQAIAGAAGSFAGDVASQVIGGSDQPIDYPAMYISALGGASGEMAGSLIAGTVRAIRERPGAYINAQTGQLTPAGVRIMTEAGIDPADLTDQIARSFAERARRVGPVAADRTARAEEFGFELTPGQASGDIPRQAFEQAAIHNARGETAGALMRDRTNRMHESIRRGRDDLVDTMAPGAAPGSTVQDSAAEVLQGVRSRYEYDTMRADALWENARGDAAQIRVPMREIERLPSVIRSEMRDNDIVRVEQTLHPASWAAMNLVGDFAEGRLGDLSTRSGNAVAGNLGATYEAVDSLLRKTLSEYGTAARASPADARVFRRIVSGYERWLDGIEDSALMSGLPDAIDRIRDARNASREVFQQYGERTPIRGASDKAGATIERMIHSDVTDQEVVNWIWGSMKTGKSPEAYRVLRRLNEILEPGAPEREALKRGMLQKVLMEAPEVTQPGPEAMAQNLFKFVNGEGRAIANQLFPDAELSRLRRFGAALRDTVPDPLAKNPSKSGYEMARAFIDAFGAAGAPLRIFNNVTVDLPNIVRATTPGAPPVRARVNPAFPAMGAIGAERALDDDPRVK